MCTVVEIDGKRYRTMGGLRLKLGDELVVPRCDYPLSTFLNPAMCLCPINWSGMEKQNFVRIDRKSDPLVWKLTVLRQ